MSDQTTPGPAARDRPDGPDAAEGPLRPLPVTTELREHPRREVRITLVGEIDVHDQGLVRDTLSRAVAAERPVTIDCRGLVFMDSSVLVLFALLVRAQRSVTVTGLRPELMALLDITGLRRLLHFAD